MVQKITMANFITACRLAISAAMVITPTFSSSFYALYLLAGATDVVDGAVARKTNTVSSFGSRLDTVADMAFVAVCLFKFLPALEVPGWLYVWTAVIALIKLANLASGYVMRRELVALHSFMNKATGLLLFLFPLTLRVVDLEIGGAVVCAVATVAAIQEGHWIRKGKTW